MIVLIAVATFLIPCVFSQCCMPRYLSGNISDAWDTTYSEHFMMDFTRNKMIIEPYNDEPSTTPEYTLKDFNTKRSYNFYSEMYYICWSDAGTGFTTSGTFPKCLPSGATKLESSTPKTNDKSTPDFDTWQFDVNFFKDDESAAPVVIKMTFPSGTCSPVKAEWSIDGEVATYLDFDTNSASTPTADDLLKFDKDNSECEIR